MELKADIEGYIYFETNESDTGRAVDAFLQAMYGAGINADNVDISYAEVRNDDDVVIDSY